MYQEAQSLAGSHEVSPVSMAAHMIALQREMCSSDNRFL